MDHSCSRFLERCLIAEIQEKKLSLFLFWCYVNPVYVLPAADCDLLHVETFGSNKDSASRILLKRLRHLLYFSRSKTQKTHRGNRVRENLKDIELGKNIMSYLLKWWAIVSLLWWWNASVLSQELFVVCKVLISSIHSLGQLVVPPVVVDTTWQFGSAFNRLPN